MLTPATASGCPARVSVIIPTHNRRGLLMRAIASVRTQTYEHWELVIVDDGSSDGSRDAVAALGDPRIRVVVNGQRRGAGYSRWRGAEEASGDYLAFLDSDDWWHPNKLERQLAAVYESGRNRVVVFGPMSTGDGGDKLPGGNLSFYAGRPIVDFIYTGRGFPLQTSSLLISADLAKQLRFDPALKVNQDTDYLMRLDHAGARFIYMPESLQVQDNAPRADRISFDPTLVEPSLAWFRQVSVNWSPRARRGYFLNDAAIRLARAGQRWRALGYFLRGVDWHSEPYFLLRQFLRVLAGGDMPASLSALWKSLRRGLGSA